MSGVQRYPNRILRAVDSSCMDATGKTHIPADLSECEHGWTGPWNSRPCSAYHYSPTEGRELMSIELHEDRRKALIAASIRLGIRLEFALEGKPAWTWLDKSGNVIPGVSQPRVLFAPPWAEDPRQLNVLLARVDNCLNVSG